MTFRIEDAILRDEDAERLYESRPELRAGPSEYCPTCRKTGTYRWQGAEHDCDCVRQLQLAKHYSAAGIGVTYQRQDWTDVQQSVIDEVTPLMRYLENHQNYIARGIGLLMHGPVGTGKTMVATLLLKDLLKLGYTGFSTTFARTINAFTSTFRSNEEKRWFADKFMYSQVLLLDDLGRELRSVHSNLPQSTFDLILRTRVQEGRPTLLTTNCTPAELETGYGAAVLSMLKEQSLLLEFSGTDFRPQVNQRTLAEVEAGEVRPLS